ncbi:MAG: hypothetical protein IKX14_01700, partial [Neisseriaceae bacterium]|nr:hypothetical protein [Neisseriaceae bacterium]
LLPTRFKSFRQPENKYSNAEKNNCHCEPCQRQGVRNLLAMKNAPNDYCRRVGKHPTNNAVRSCF